MRTYRLCEGGGNVMALSRLSANLDRPSRLGIAYPYFDRTTQRGFSPFLPSLLMLNIFVE
jgi:hypothetical protein